MNIARTNFASTSRSEWGIGDFDLGYQGFPFGRHALAVSPLLRDPAFNELLGCPERSFNPLTVCDQIQGRDVGAVVSLKPRFVRWLKEHRVAQ